MNNNQVIVLDDVEAAEPHQPVMNVMRKRLRTGPEVEPGCSKCGELGTKRLRVVGSKQWCNECMTGLPTCTLCKEEKQVSSMKILPDGTIACKECLLAAPIKEPTTKCCICMEAALKETSLRCDTCVDAWMCGRCLVLTIRQKNEFACPLCRQAYFL